MTTLTITHTHTEGTLIDGTSKGDGTNALLKSAGWRWFRTLGTWGIPNSRDRQPNTHIIDRARAAGLTVVQNRCPKIDFPRVGARGPARG